jgi:hypothetical protein
MRHRMAALALDLSSDDERHGDSYAVAARRIRARTYQQGGSLSRPS